MRILFDNASLISCLFCCCCCFVAVVVVDGGGSGGGVRVCVCVCVCVRYLTFRDNDERDWLHKTTASVLTRTHYSHYSFHADLARGTSSNEAVVKLPLGPL